MMFNAEMTTIECSQAAACAGAEWRATADEDGQYCCAVAL
jgi:hypothetical protein